MALNIVNEVVVVAQYDFDLFEWYAPTQNYSNANKSDLNKTKQKTPADT